MKDEREAEEAKKKEARRKREEKEKKKLLDGSSLGEELSQATGGSAADWVKRSRKLGPSILTT